MLADFRAYYWENRLFLSDDIAENIQAIYTFVNHIYELACETLPDSRYKGNSFDNIKRDLSSYERFTAKYSKEDWDSLDYADLTALMINYVYERVTELSRIYKSVAEVPNDK